MAPSPSILSSVRRQPPSPNLLRAAGRPRLTTPSALAAALSHLLRAAGRSSASTWAPQRCSSSPSRPQRRSGRLPSCCPWTTTQRSAWTARGGRPPSPMCPLPSSTHVRLHRSLILRVYVCADAMQAVSSLSSISLSHKSFGVIWLIVLQTFRRMKLKKGDAINHWAQHMFITFPFQHCICADLNIMCC